MRKFLKFLPSAALLASTATTQAYQITLAWEQTDPTTTGYTVYQESAPGAYFALGVTNALSWPVNSLEPGKTYRFYVTTLAPSGESLPSSLVEHRVEASVPAVPQNPWAQALSQSRIDVHWDRASTNTLTILVERSLDSANWTQVATVPGTATHYLNGGLRRNRVYYYRVRACNGMGCSPYTPPRWARTFR